MKSRLSLILLCCIFFLTSCPEPTNNVPRDTTITLELISTWTTSVRLKVAVTDTTDTWTFELTRDDSVVVGAEVLGSDTVVVDGGLNPGTEYSYRAFFMDNGDRVDTSETMTAVTMDTTSHSFVWEIDTLGNYGSYLMDAAIINENSIRVVGNIETDSGEFNAARWDGNKWEMLDIYSNTLNLYSIQYFNENDLWVLGSYPIHWDGDEWTHYHLTDMGIIPGGLSGEIWGSNPNDVYFVGRYGRIVHYDGTSFTRMESGTSLKLLDIWGVGDHVYTVGHSDGQESIALELIQGEWQTLRLSPTAVADLENDNIGRMQNVWAYGDTVYIIAHGGLLKYSLSTSEEIILPADSVGTSGYSLHGLKGNSPNDIAVVAKWGEVVHFNGANWRRDLTVSDQFEPADIRIYGMDFKGDLIVAVGELYDGSHAFIMRGLR